MMLLSFIIFFRKIENNGIEKIKMKFIESIDLGMLFKKEEKMVNIKLVWNVS